MNVKKSPLAMKEPAGEQTANNGTTRPKNPPANTRPTEGNGPKKKFSFFDQGQCKSLRY